MWLSSDLYSTDFPPNTSAFISLWPKSAACHICGTRHHFVHKINRGISRLPHTHTPRNTILCILAQTDKRSIELDRRGNIFFFTIAKKNPESRNLFWLSGKRLAIDYVASKLQHCHNYSGMPHNAAQGYIMWQRLLYIVVK